MQTDRSPQVQIGIAEVEVTCHRCGKTIQGLQSVYGTSGFYRGSATDRDIGWSKYMHEGETILCDDCMQSDPRYRHDYGLTKN